MLGNSMFHLIQYEFKIIHFIWVVCMLKKAQMRTYNPFFFPGVHYSVRFHSLCFIFILLNKFCCFIFICGCVYFWVWVWVYVHVQGWETPEEGRESEEIGSHVPLLLSRPPTWASFVSLPIVMFPPEAEFLGKPIFCWDFPATWHSFAVPVMFKTVLSFSDTVAWRKPPWELFPA